MIRNQETSTFSFKVIEIDRTKVQQQLCEALEENQIVSSTLTWMGYIIHIVTTQGQGMLITNKLPDAERKNSFMVQE